ncbi:MAG: Ca-activated chloride channel family protein, partial [Porticoccus sp.]
FVERRQGDRLGLILFGTRPYLQTPLTFDRKTMNTLLGEAQIGFAGEKTAIGDAIGLAIKRLKKRPENHRVLILLTDGANSAGEAQPLEAADIAAREGITIYTIGIGAEVMVQRGFFRNTRVNPSRDLDETTLTAIADKTGGLYFRARNPEELESIYLQLDQLEPIDQEAETVRPTRALFYWPLGLALLCSLLLVPMANRGGQD